MKKRTPLATLIYLSMKNRLVVFILAAVMFGWGIIVSPFDFTLSFLPSSPLSVDALPDIGENQQIVFTKWPGAAPSDVDDQITYPLSQLLMGIPGVKTVRSSSMLGFSSVYVIFSEDVGFYWSRSRLLEKLSALPPNFLPEGVTPMLGPPGTALGQVFWYTVEGRDEKGNPAGGWDLAELRSVQDYFVRYRLSSVDGVAEVASIGGFVREFHVEVNPDSLRKYGVTLLDVYKAVHSANKDVGGRTLEINSVEYVIRGAGRAVALTDFSRAVIKTVGGVPVTVGQVAQVVEGPGLRRGLLDKEGTEAVGGVVTVTEGANTMLTVQRIRQRMKELSRGMPSKVLPDGRRSTLTVVPFYDRSVLIRETVKTLEHALRDEILVTIIVILVMLGHLKSSIIVSSILPLAVLLTFIIMKNLNMEGNILALSGIGIAIGTMVDMGIVITENIVRHLKTPREGEDSFQTILRATNEVASAVVTSVATTVVSFIPVFAMTATEGKLFKPLAYTKTFAIMGSLILALFLVPTLALTLLGKQRPKTRTMLSLLALAFSVVVTTRINMLLGMLFFTTTLYGFFLEKIPLRLATVVRWGVNVAVLLVAVWILSTTWSPLGSSLTAMDNFLMVSLLLGSILTVFLVFLKFYGPLLRWCLDHRIQFLSLMAFFMLTGVVVWKGFSSVSGFFPSQMVQTQAGYKLTKNFRGLEQQFMPDLDEGSFLYMPTVMPHASLGSAHRIMRLQDLSIRAIPEVQMVVGKLGRAQTPLDPAPISMFETIVTYKPEFLRSASGKLALFAHDASGSDWFRDVQGKKLPAPDGKPYKIRGRFKRDTKGALVADADGKPFRLWRSELLPRLNRGRKYWKGITGPDDIWKRITQRATVPGSTSAPKLQPISTRIVMLQTGIKAAMAIKVLGTTMESVEKVGVELEKIIRKVPVVDPLTVSAERTVAKPYLIITPDDEKMARYALSRSALMAHVELAVGGKQATTVIEKRERIPVRVRFMRDYRDSILALEELSVPVGKGQVVPLKSLAHIRYERGPQVIKSEESFVTLAVTFDGKKDFSRVRVMEAVLATIDKAQKNKSLVLPHSVTLKPAGSYENHLRAARTLKVIVPLALIIIFLLIYLQFHSVAVTLIIFSGVAVAWAGGFMMIWLYGQSWFMDFSLMGVNMRELLHIQPLNLSVAVWVGFLALFGIATDDGVVMATYLGQLFKKERPTVAQIRQTTIKAGKMRVRACLMTTATTLLALLPILTSRGRGADVMGPMAVPLFGGMALELFTMLVVPVLYSLYQESRLHLHHLSLRIQQHH